MTSEDSRERNPRRKIRTNREEKSTLLLFNQFR